MRWFHLSLGLLAVGAVCGCQTLRDTSGAEYARNAPVAPALRGAVEALRTPRYVQADRPGSSPIAPMLQNRSPWSSASLVSGPTEMRPFSPIAAALQKRTDPPKPMIDRPMPVRSAALQAKQPPIWRPKTPKTIANVAESKSASATTAKSCWESAEELAECRLYELAIQQYTQAVELDPELAGKAARRTAPLYAELKKTDQASHAYETAIMDHPNDVALLLEIGEFHHTGGRSSEAEKWLRKALEKSPDNEQALRTLSLLKTAPGNTSEAVDTLWRVMPAADSHMAADAHLATGNALAKSGKTAAAIDAYLKALNLEPPQSPAKSRADQPETMEPEEPAKVMWRAIAATGKKSFEE